MINGAAFKGKNSFINYVLKQLEKEEVYFTMSWNIKDSIGTFHF